MKVYAAVTIARMTEGEIISIKFEKAWTDLQKATDYVNSKAKNFTEIIEVPNQGPVQFVCERGLQEFVVDEGE